MEPFQTLSAALLSIRNKEQRTECSKR